MTAYCNTCGQPAYAPTRRIMVGHVTMLATPGTFGEVVEGCVDAFHDDYADAWHVRSDAEAIRAAERLRRTDIGHEAERARALLATGAIPGMGAVTA